jgi:hypothetical protein
MKHLFVLLIFISLKNGLQAQVTDSTSTIMKTDSARASNMADSAGAANMSDSARAGNMNNNMNSSSTMTDSSKASMPNRMDSTQTTMPNRMNSMSNSSNSTMSNSSSANSNTAGTMQNPTNSQGMEGYAALPVAESFIPADVMDKIKSKYGNGTIIYDVTPVRAAMPMDSAMQSKDSSSMQQPHPDSASAMAMTAAPVKYNYVVRIIKDGVMQTEYLADDGTTTVMPGDMNKPQQ